MASSINAITTGSGGVITTADNSGVLNLQTGGTTAVSVDATQNVTFTNGANLPNTFGFKNRIINGAMVIDQRNAGASVTQTTSTSLFSVDRWKIYGAVTSKFTAQQNAGSVTPPVGFSNYLGVTSSSAYTVSSTDTFVVSQSVEGYNVSDLAWGTANAQAVTLSFRVYSSLTGTFGGSITNDAQNYSYPFSYSIPVANTWTTISVTIAGPTAGTWLGTTNAGLILWFGLGIGATYSGTAGSWAASGYYSATGATSVVGTNGATFYITGVQLEKGATATSFDVRDYGRELMMCQRYLPAFNSTSTVSPVCDAFTNSTGNVIGSYKFKVSTRVPPTGITASAGNTFAFSNTANYTGSAISFGGASNDLSTFALTISGATSLAPGYIYCNSATGKILFTGCEL